MSKDECSRWAWGWYGEWPWVLGTLTIIIACGVYTWWDMPLVDNGRDLRDWAKHERTIQATDDTILALDRRAYKAESWVNYCNERAAYTRHLARQACDDLERVTILVESRAAVTRVCKLLMAVTEPLS